MFKVFFIVFLAVFAGMTIAVPASEIVEDGNISSSPSGEANATAEGLDEMVTGDKYDKPPYITCYSIRRKGMLKIEDWSPSNEGASIFFRCEHNFRVHANGRTMDLDHVRSGKVL